MTREKAASGWHKFETGNQGTKVYRLCSTSDVATCQHVNTFSNWSRENGSRRYHDDSSAEREFDSAQILILTRYAEMVPGGRKTSHLKIHEIIYSPGIRMHIRTGETLDTNISAPGWPYIHAGNYVRPMRHEREGGKKYNNKINSGNTRLTTGW